MNILFDKLYTSINNSIQYKDNNSVTRVRGTVPNSMSEILNNESQTEDRVITNSFRPYYGI